jgi:hypothetical protein
MAEQPPVKPEVFLVAPLTLFAVLDPSKNWRVVCTFINEGAAKWFLTSEDDENKMGWVVRQYSILHEYHS